MEKVLRRIQREISKLEKMLETINRFQKSEPEGNLKIQTKQNRNYFYHQYKGTGVGCKCQHRNAIKFRNKNVVFFRCNYLSSGSTKS